MLQRLVYRIILTVACGASVFTSFAGVEDLPVKEIDGKLYHYYEVPPRQTIYSLTRELGITIEELYETNPTTRDGLKAYSTLIFPVSSGVSNVPRRIHKVKKGETVYGISKMYGVSKEDIFAWNTSAIDGIRVGEELIVSPPAEIVPAHAEEIASEDTISVSVPQNKEYIDYIVKDKETFYSIARAHNISIHDLEASNPEVGILRSGQTIRIPVLRTEDSPEIPVDQDMSEINLVRPDETAGESTDQETEKVEERQTIDIALVLPLMSSSQSRSRQADTYLDFYKGFLIAVDSMRHCGTPINLRVIDTEGSVDAVNLFVDSPEFENTDVVVGPDTKERLDLVASAARDKSVYVFNPFVVKDESYQTNPMMIQANIPQSMMYDKAIDGLITRYADCLPVFVDFDGGSDEKSAFVSRLKSRLKASDIESRELSFESYADMRTLSLLPEDRTLLFIPVSWRQTELNKLLPSLVELKGKGRQVMLFGYPEWTTFRGETQKHMHDVGTVVYSRFYSCEDDDAAEALDGRFVYWYGKPMLNVLPRQGLLGFDCGMYLINAVRNNRGDLSAPSMMRDGIQNGFHFVSPDGAQGQVNDMLYFINYRPDGSIDKILL